MESSSSRPDANSHCWPVTRFSRRPASASRFASPRTFTTYARRVGYLESVLKVILGTVSDGPIEVDVMELRRKAMPGCQRNVAVSTGLRGNRACSDGAACRSAVARGIELAARRPAAARRSALQGQSWSTRASSCRAVLAPSRRRLCRALRGGGRRARQARVGLWPLHRGGRTVRSAP
jgi:hypothetical protein